MSHQQEPGKSGALQDRIAVVTGGAQGLGEGLSLRLGREGCDVVVVDIREDQAAATAERVRQETGRRALSFRADVTVEAEVQALFDRTVSEWGRVDIAVANAAILIADPIVRADAEKWRAVMNVNLFGYFLTAKHAARVMMPRRNGSIVQINSKSGKKGSAA
ncbi:MAG: SDR family NAD(P)-dependent oxidoreductase, partial [Kiritimatiellia bacterium]|nr:SDR family NAD(P)-dependent oxidoreductase [Kiritimatiellia bacterium]